MGGLYLRQTQDKKTLKRINLLIKDIQRNHFTGIGKPEPLKDNLAGYWSRRIDEKNRSKVSAGSPKMKPKSKHHRLFIEKKTPDIQC